MLELRKRAYETDKISEKVKQIKRERVDSVLMEFPNEVLEIIFNNLNKNDMINLSSTNKEHRLLIFDEVFKNVQMKWKNIKIFIDNFKYLDKINKLKIICDMENEKETNNGEWSASFKKLFEYCINLHEMEIGLIGSARCLKYKDDFDIESSNKIKKLTLESNNHYNEGDVNDKAMFELAQLQRFHEIKKLTLKGFSITKDNYFYPKMKEDFSDFEKRKLDGKLIKLKDIKLINCAWEYPLSLKEVFAPEYPIPGLSNMNNERLMNCQPEKLELVYTGAYTRFLSSERFKNFINTEYNQKFLFEVEFYSKLRELSIIVVPEKDRLKEDNEMDKPKTIQYFPWLEMLNLSREFAVCTSTEGIIKQSILNNLEKLVLIGWRSSSVLDVDKILNVAQKKNKLKYIEIGLISAKEEHVTGVAQRVAQLFKNNFDNNNCIIKVYSM
jgi:hypothetical protein